MNDHRHTEVVWLSIFWLMNFQKLTELGASLYSQLESSLAKLEIHFQHNFQVFLFTCLVKCYFQYVEYTVEDGRLYFLEVLFS